MVRCGWYNVATGLPGDREVPRTLQLVVRSKPNGRPVESVQSLLIMMNGDDREHHFELPATKGVWVFELDTSVPDGWSRERFRGKRAMTVPSLTLKLAVSVFD